MIIGPGPLFTCIAVIASALVYGYWQNYVLRAKLRSALQRQKSDELELSQRFALDTLKDEFVSTVSHELRTPLTSIRGALGLLSSGVIGSFDGRAEELIRIASSNTERLIRLINDILDLERMSSGRAVLQIRRCSLTDLVNHAIETMTAMADSVNVRLVIDAASKAILPSIFFDGDPDRILQVLTNLLSNAIKFSPAESTVTVAVETPPDALIIRVSDQGRGIPPGQLEKIFERFSQVEHDDALAKGGTGLGLTICRSIVQQHGGTIWAQHNVTKGASLCVKLPRLQRTDDAAVSATPGQARIHALSPTLNPAFESAVLVCDDDSVHRSRIAQQLRERGHTVFEAASSEEAIAIAEARPPHTPLQAILLDLQMSDKKGWEILSVLTRTASTATIPIVVLSVEQPVEAAEGEIGSTPLQRSVPEQPLFTDLVRAIDSGRGSSQVLLVEDDEDLAEVILGGFAQTNVVVNHVSTLQRAIEVCADHRPDLLMLDLTLPDGDGFSLVEWLRGRPELRSLPLIVYSGRELSRDERAKLLLGPTLFLTKAKVHTQDVEHLVLSMVKNGRDVHDRDAPKAGTLPVAPMQRALPPNQLSA